MATKRKRIKGSGGLYLRGATWWMSYSINGTQFRESTGQTQKQAAQDVLNKKLAAVTLGLVTVRQTAQPKTTDVLTVEKLLEYVVRDYEVRKKPSLKSLRGYVKKLSAKIGEQPAGAITYSRLFELQQRWLSEGVSESSINKWLGCLRRSYRLARRDGVLKEIPEFPDRLDESAAIRQGFVEPADFHRFLAAFTDLNLRDFVEWLGLTGMRSGEAKKLHWTYTHDGVLYIPGPIEKNRDARGIPLAGGLKDVIERRKRARVVGCPFIFHRDGVAVNTFKKAWDSACKATGLTLKPHDLCRSAIRNLTRAGVDRDVAKKIAGRKTGSIFSRYNIVSDSDVREGLEKVSAYVESKRT